jgi:RND family efflux transporter MFP subunit
MKRNSALILFAAAVVACAVYFLGIRPRQAAGLELEERSRATASVPVSVTIARPGSAARELTLPATLQPLFEARVYARTNGYVDKWFVDIGDQVKEGQIMARIDSPEVDQQLNQAKANLESARADLKLAEVTARRWQHLGSENAVSQQEVDEKAADYAARQAAVHAAQANVERLEQMQDFEKVEAPFDGVVAARGIDVGTLINAGAGPELFRLSQNGVLRVYADVPQSYVAAIRAGLPAEVLVAEFPRRVFAGHVTRMAGALDAASRTLQTEVQIPNAEGLLYPGMFCQVRFKLASPDAPILIPSNDAIIRTEGTLVAMVTGENRIHLQAVKLGRDFGTEIEILDGLEPGARIVDNPSDALAEGTAVDPVPRREADPQP